MTAKELNKIPGVRPAAAVAQHLQDLQHPLMPAFLQMVSAPRCVLTMTLIGFYTTQDTDQSYTIDASELAHVLTRVKGSVITEKDASSLIEMADTDHSGNVDFEEVMHRTYLSHLTLTLQFKAIAAKSSREHDWAKAAEAVGAPAALFNAGTALADSVDSALRRTHSGLAAGSDKVTTPQSRLA